MVARTQQVVRFDEEAVQERHDLASSDEEMRTLLEAACDRADLLCDAALVVHDVGAPGSSGTLVLLCERALAEPETARVGQKRAGPVSVERRMPNRKRVQVLASTGAPGNGFVRCQGLVLF